MPKSDQCEDRSIGVHFAVREVLASIETYIRMTKLEQLIVSTSAPCTTYSLLSMHDMMLPTSMCH